MYGHIGCYCLRRFAPFQAPEYLFGYFNVGRYDQPKMARPINFCGCGERLPCGPAAEF